MEIRRLEWRVGYLEWRVGYLLWRLRYWSCSCQLRLLDRGHTMAAITFSF
jgi:hypothetical protein